MAGLGVYFVATPLTRPLDGFLGARLGFIVIAGLIPPLTAWFATTFRGDRWDGWVAGLLAVFSGFYLAFLPTTDTFGIYMVLGALFLQVAWLSFGLHTSAESGKPRLWGPFALGFIAGSDAPFQGGWVNLVRDCVSISHPWSIPQDAGVRETG